MARPSKQPVASLLVFTLGPRRERERRRLLPSRWAQRELAFHRQCLTATLAAGRQCGFQLEVSSPQRLELPSDVRQTRQAGSHFGERLETAMAAARHGTDHPLVVVGTDAPDLAKSQLQRALLELRRHPDRVVVGPSTDGGFYLLASTTRLELDGVHWQCPRTLDSLLAALEAAGKPVTLLEPLSDVDHRRDLESWLAHRRIRDGWSEIVAALRSFLALARRVAAGHSGHPVAPQLALARALRAPPL